MAARQILRAALPLLVILLLLSASSLSPAVAAPGFEPAFLPQTGQPMSTLDTALGLLGLLCIVGGGAYWLAAYQHTR